MKTEMLILALVLGLLLLAGGAALANGGPELPREVLGSGASDSAAGAVTLRATLGQPVVGVVSSGGSVTLGQGFWHGVRYRLYLPLIQR